MGIISRFIERVKVMAEGGSRYCSKKTDDICGDSCDEVDFSLSHLKLNWDKCGF